jgi:glycosyltransferase involved in cell wall biosynthesis
MRVLVVALPHSVHTYRWLEQFLQTDWEILLFPSVGADSILNAQDFCSRFPELTKRPTKKGLFHRTVKRVAKRDRASLLASAIRTIRPNFIHSLETQHAGYLALEAKRKLRTEFPVWLHTNWGSDLYLFGRLAEHKDRITSVLQECDYYSCECRRDVDLAAELGFRGEVVGVFPNAGGFKLDDLRPQRDKVVTSFRRHVVVKGYQGWAGRALVALRALERCSDRLGGYSVVIYSAASEDVRIKAELLRLNAGVPVRLIPPGTSHEEILFHHSRARVYVGLSISDAISTSLLEAMVMGAFPVQSDTSCAGEWIRDGETGLLVPPEDPEPVELAIRRALEDDELVDRAAAKNWELATNRLAYDDIRREAISMYDRVLVSPPKGR